MDNSQCANCGHIDAIRDCDCPSHPDNRMVCACYQAAAARRFRARNRRATAAIKQQLRTYQSDRLGRVTIPTD